MSQTAGEHFRVHERDYFFRRSGGRLPLFSRLGGTFPDFLSCIRL